MTYSTIAIEQQGRLAIIRLSRSKSGNIVDQTLADDLAEACQALNEDDAVHTVILTAGPGGCFSLGEAAGAAKAGSRQAGGCSTSGSLLTPAAIASQAVASLNCPVIAAINGDAIGAGLELAMSCDIRIASSKARFGMPQVGAGTLPSGGGTQLLPRLVGKGKATEMILLGTTINAAEAHRIGLANEVVAPAKTMARAQELAKVILSRGPIAVRYAKEAVSKGMDMTLSQGLRLEADLNIILQTTDDRAEGVSAFLQKRKSQFKGK